MVGLGGLRVPVGEGSHGLGNKVGLPGCGGSWLPTLPPYMHTQRREYPDTPPPAPAELRVWGSNLFTLTPTDGTTGSLGPPPCGAGGAGALEKGFYSFIQE